MFLLLLSTERKRAVLISPLFWQQQQRTQYEKPLMRAMTELYDNVWNKLFEKLVEFKQKNGNCLVPSNYEEDKSLRRWVDKQRTAHSNSKMQPDRKGLLNELEFVWNVEEHQWHLQYDKLVEFKRKNGHCLVPKRYQEDACLGNWVGRQRESHRKNKLRPDRKGLLDEMGFVWSVANSTPWHQQYEKLVEFKRNNGHCIVPQRYQEDASLGNWVLTQRQLHSKNKLRLDRKLLLNEIGFVWKAHEVAANGRKTWHQQYEKLVEFKQKNGNCLVPQKYEHDMSLGMWVRTQRKYHANTKLRPDRKKLLDEIVFVWKVDPRAAARSPTTNGRGLVITGSLFHALFKSFPNSIRIPKRQPAVWDFQTKH
jgi:hypothetical protein